MNDSVPPPLDQVEALHQLYRPGLPTFPISAEVQAMIPDDLPGELPTTLEEYIRIMHARLMEREARRQR